MLIILLIAVAIVGGAIVWAWFSRSGGARAQHEIVDFPPKPKWKPTLPVDIPRTVQAFGYYTDHKRVFAVFTHGTCVLLPGGSTNAEQDAKEILDKVYHYHPDFTVQPMDDGHFTVSYSQPAYSVVFKEEWEAHRDYIDRNHLEGVVRDEVILPAKGEANKFKIGLFGRARMFLDAQAPVVVQIWKPQP